MDLFGRRRLIAKLQTTIGSYISQINRIGAVIDTTYGLWSYKENTGDVLVFPPSRKSPDPHHVTEHWKTTAL